MKARPVSGRDALVLSPPRSVRHEMPEAWPGCQCSASRRDQLAGTIAAPFRGPYWSTPLDAQPAGLGAAPRCPGHSPGARARPRGAPSHRRSAPGACHSTLCLPVRPPRASMVRCCRPGLSPGRMSSASIKGAPSHGARPLDAQLAPLGRDPRAPGAQPGCQCSASTRTQRPTLGAGGVPADLSLPAASHEHGEELSRRGSGSDL